MFHLAPVSKGSGPARVVGHSEVLHGMVALSVMLGSAMGYIGPCWDIPGRLSFAGKNGTGVTSVPGGLA
jgi:hypothetical protein